MLLVAAFLYLLHPIEQNRNHGGGSASGIWWKLLRPMTLCGQVTGSGQAENQWARHRAVPLPSFEQLRPLASVVL